MEVPQDRLVVLENCLAVCDSTASPGNFIIQ